MNRKVTKRARSPEAKAQRKMQILAATAKVLEQSGPEAVSLNAIAREAGIVKSNIYRYFESREEILLRLLIDDLTLTVSTLQAAVPGPLPVAQIAEIIALGFVQNPRLCHLISQMAPTLEHNISNDTLREIKLSLNAQAGIAATTLARALPQLSVETASQTIHLLFSLVAGLWPVSNPGPELAKLLQEPQFSHLNQSFNSQIHAATLTILLGVIAKNS